MLTFSISIEYAKRNENEKKNLFKQDFVVWKTAHKYWCRRRIKLECIYISCRNKLKCSISNVIFYFLFAFIFILFWRHCIFVIKMKIHHRNCCTSWINYTVTLQAKNKWQQKKTIQLIRSRGAFHDTDWCKTIFCLR